MCLSIIESFEHASIHETTMLCDSSSQHCINTLVTDYHTMFLELNSRCSYLVHCSYITLLFSSFNNVVACSTCTRARTQSLVARASILFTLWFRLYLFLNNKRSAFGSVRYQNETNLWVSPTLRKSIVGKNDEILFKSIISMGYSISSIKPLGQIIHYYTPHNNQINVLFSIMFTFWIFDE